MSVTGRLARSAGLVGLATLSSRILGLVRDATLARIFGAQAVMDSFNIATRIPSLLRELFAEGAMSAAFVPTFTKTLARRGQAPAWRLGAVVLNTLLVATAVLVILGIVFAGPLAGFYAPEFGGRPSAIAGYDSKLDLTVALTRITMPFLTVIALAAVFMGMLNAVGRFFIPAFAPAVFNVVMIGGAAFSALAGPTLGFEPIVGVAWAFVLGGVAQMAVQIPALRAEGYRHKWTLTTDDGAEREVLRLMGPGTLGQAASQINLFVNTMLATSIPFDGPVSWLQNAFRLMYLPIGIFGVSVSTAVLPDLSRHAQRGAMDDMRATLSWGLRLMLMLSVPATLGLVVLAQPIVELVFEGGEFTANDTRSVAWALQCYAVGLVAYSAVKIVSPTFYALGDSRTPMYASMASVVANVLLSLALVRGLSYAGLALGTALAAVVNAGLLMAILSGRLKGLDGARIARSFAKISIASAVMAAAAFWAEQSLHAWLTTPSLFVRIVRVSGGIAAGLGVLALMAHLLRIEEFRIAMGRVVGRLKPR